MKKTIATIVGAGLAALILAGCAYDYDDYPGYYGGYYHYEYHHHACRDYDDCGHGDYR